MADAITGTADLSTSTAAYERLAYYKLRLELYFDRCATVKPTRQTHRGASVTFFIYDDLSPVTGSLTEKSDVDAVALSDNDVTVTLDEYGNAVQTTAKLRGTSLLEVDVDAANIIGYNAGHSLDTLARDVLLGGTSNVLYGGTKQSKDSLTTGDVLTAAKVRQARTILANNNSKTVQAGLYKAFISPDVSYDLRTETGDAAWRAPHTYVQPSEIWNGSIGAFEGFDFIETPRLSTGGELTGSAWEDAGASDANVYPTLFIGSQALAKAWSSKVSGPLPKIVIGPVVDKLRRFHTIGWYWLGAFGLFREAESLVRVETISSIG